MTLRLYSGDNTKATTDFWNKGHHLERLQEVFKYCANLRDYLQKSFPAYFIERVSDARINGWLTDANALSLQI